MPPWDGGYSIVRRHRLSIFRKRTVWIYVRWLFLMVPGMKPRTVKRNMLVALLYLLLLGLSVSVVFLLPMG